MVFEALMIGIVIGFIRDGRFNNFAFLDFKGFYFILIGALCEFLPFFMNQTNLISQNANYIVSVGLFFLFLFLVLNHKLTGFRIILLGFLLNTAAFLTNHFKMPILILKGSQEYLTNLKFAIEVGEVNNYILFDRANAITRYLGKFVIMPDWYPFSKYFAIGDVIIMAGMILFIVKYMEIHKKSSFGTKYYK